MNTVGNKAVKKLQPVGNKKTYGDNCGKVGNKIPGPPKQHSEIWLDSDNWLDSEPWID